MSRRHGNRNPEGDVLERRLARLITEAEALGGEGEQRRETLIEQAEERGLERSAAEQAYDLALEEKLPPAYGIALVHQGISIHPVTSDSPTSASEPAEPEWIDNPPTPRAAGRERRIRETFRRLRSFLDGDTGARQAIEAFAREPDLELFDY